MSKWSSLNTIKGTPVVEQRSKPMTFIIVLVLCITCTIAIAQAIHRENHKSIIVKPLDPVLTVIQPKVINTLETPEAPVDAIVETKSVEVPVVVQEPTMSIPESKYWSMNHSDAPYIESENGLSFSDFQEAFQHGREKPIQDRIHTKDTTSVESLQEMLRASGKNVYEFLDTQGLTVSDGVLDAIQFQTFSSRGPNHNVQQYSHDEMILAKDFLQDVSANMSIDTAITVLREISNAQIEFQKLDLVVPQMPQEQRDGIAFWSSTTGPAAKIAKQILDRVQ